jgi:hypothetical protein
MMLRHGRFFYFQFEPVAAVRSLTRKRRSGPFLFPVAQETLRAPKMISDSTETMANEKCQITNGKCPLFAVASYPFAQPFDPQFPTIAHDDDKEASAGRGPYGTAQKLPDGG